jgi:hypothetical protein
MPTSLSPSCRYGGAAPTWAASPPQLVASVSIGQLRVKRYFRLRGRRGKSGTRPPTIARIYWATIQLQKGDHPTAKGLQRQRTRDARGRAAAGGTLAARLASNFGESIADGCGCLRADGGADCV